MTALLLVAARCSVMRRIGRPAYGNEDNALHGYAGAGAY
jgi:hypothetical protein